MSVRDRLITLSVILIWGLNFLAVQVALELFPPIFLAGLRYMIVAIPVLLFIPRPQAPARWLAGYGLGFGVLQFGLLFLAINAGMPAGLSSVVLQAGPPIAIIFGALFLREPVSAHGWASITVAAIGMIVLGADRAQSTGIGPMLLTVGAAAGWALGTLSSRLAQPDSTLRFALWMSVIPPLPLLTLSAVVEGPTGGWHALRHLATDLEALMALGYIVVFGTVVGAALWSYLLKRHPAALIAPYSMLVPVVGIAGAWVALDEVPTRLGAIGALLVVGGVFLGSPRKQAENPVADRTETPS